MDIKGFNTHIAQSVEDKFLDKGRIGSVAFD
jgi:hypothetical protein